MAAVPVERAPAGPMAAGPQPGDRAPEFTLPADDGTTVSLAALRGRIVVLFFYPEDDTPGCSTQACEFRDNWDEIARSGAAVFGISPDDVVSHAAFREKFAFPFPLLADSNHRVADAYGIWGEKRLFGVRYQGIRRSSLVIDAEGVVRFRLERAQGKGHAAPVLAAIRQMTSGRSA